MIFTVCTQSCSALSCKFLLFSFWVISFPYELCPLLRRSASCQHLSLAGLLLSPSTHKFDFHLKPWAFLSFSSAHPLRNRWWFFPTWIYPGHILFHCLNRGQDQKQANTYNCGEVKFSGDVWCDNQPQSSRCPSSSGHGPLRSSRLLGSWRWPAMNLWTSYPSGMHAHSFPASVSSMSSILLWLFFLFPFQHHSFSYNWVSLVPWVWEKTHTHTHTHTHTYTNKCAYNKGCVFVDTFIAMWHLQWPPWSGLAWWYCVFLHNPVTQQVISPSTWPGRLGPQSPVTLQHRPLPTHRGHRRRIWDDPHLTLLLLITYING